MIKCLFKHVTIILLFVKKFNHLKEKEKAQSEFSNIEF